MLTPLEAFVLLFAPPAVAGPVADRLTLVLTAPNTYEAEYGDELLERGIGPGLPRQELRDVALIDALLAYDLLYEADADEAPTDIADALNDVLASQGRPTHLQASELAGRRLSGPDALDALQDTLEPLGLALVLLTLDSDAYPLTVIADTQAEAARRLAAELGFTLAVY